MEREPKDDEDFSAIAFKIMTDPYVGKLTFFRIYSGKVSTGDFIYNATSNKLLIVNDDNVLCSDWDDILESFYPYNTNWVEVYEAFVEHNEILGERENEEGEEILGAFKVTRSEENQQKFHVEFTEV